MGNGKLKTNIRHFYSPPVKLCKKPVLGCVTCGKPFGFVFYWVPAVAGTTNIGFFHSLESGNIERQIPSGKRRSSAKEVRF